MSFSPFPSHRFQAQSATQKADKKGSEAKRLTLPMALLVQGTKKGQNKIFMPPEPYFLFLDCKSR